MAENKSKTSPLYTQKQTAEKKSAEVKRMGRDSDGAYRYSNRIDKGKN